MTAAALSPRPSRAAVRVQALGETPRARPTAAWHATPANFSWRVHAPHKLAAVPTGTTHPKAVFCWRCAHTNGARDPTIAHAPQCALRAARTSARPNRWACSQIYARMQLCARKRCERAPASLRCARATAQTRRARRPSSHAATPWHALCGAGFKIRGSLGATHRRSWAGRDSLRETAWFPGLAVCPSGSE